ncbi:MAG TPA: hypothetical protein PKV13_01840, partial [Propionicimonas sp.]|nr:hypothetical protein [Propionicimonas sp.]
MRDERTASRSAALRSSVRYERSVSKGAAVTGSATEPGVLLPHPDCLTTLQGWGELGPAAGVESDQPLGSWWLARIRLYLVMVIGAQQDAVFESGLPTSPPRLAVMSLTLSWGTITTRKGATT